MAARAISGFFHVADSGESYRTAGRRHHLITNKSRLVDQPLIATLSTDGKWDRRQFCADHRKRVD